jgi:hypothetical protein
MTKMTPQLNHKKLAIAACQQGLGTSLLDVQADLVFIANAVGRVAGDSGCVRDCQRQGRLLSGFALTFSLTIVSFIFRRSYLRRRF